jgi:hypothetical protein
MKMITRCPVCDQYLFDDGTWGYPDAYEVSMVIMFEARIDEVICPDCMEVINGQEGDF